MPGYSFIALPNTPSMIALHAASGRSQNFPPSVRIVTSTIVPVRYHRCRCAIARSSPTRPPWALAPDIAPAAPQLRQVVTPPPRSTAAVAVSRRAVDSAPLDATGADM